MKHSDEKLNAYIDGELSIEDELELLEDLNEDKDLCKRLSDFKQLKLLVHSTYKDDVAEQSSRTSLSKAKYSLVASVLLTLGIVGGWYSHGVIVDDGETSLQVSNKKDDTWNIVLHVNTNDEYIQRTILDETESLLESFKETNKKVKVEIVAYGKGVLLFDNEKTKFKNRLKSLQRDFDNLSYAVCGRTVKRIEDKQRRKIKLISKMTVARSGIFQIIKRQKQGWNYIRI